MGSFVASRVKMKSDLVALVLLVATVYGKYYLIETKDSDDDIDVEGEDHQDGIDGEGPFNELPREQYYKQTPGAYIAQPSPSFNTYVRPGQRYEGRFNELSRDQYLSAAPSRYGG